MRIARTLLAVIATTALLGGCAWIERSSVSSGPHPAEGDAASSEPSVSQSGRYVAFTSSADNLVPGDTNGVADVFVHDHVADTTERVSVKTDGAQEGIESSHPSISDDGRYVAYQTGNTAYVRDRQLATTTLVDNMPTDPREGSVLPSISGNGRFVAFVSLIVDSSQQFPRFGPYVRDLVTGTTRAMPNPGVDGSFLFPDVGPSLSDDGSRIVYSGLDNTEASHLPEGFYRFETLVADTATATVVSTVYEDLIPSAASDIPRIESTISGDGTQVALAKTVDGVATIFRDDLDAPDLQPVLTDIPEPRGLALSDDGRVLGFDRSSQYVVSTDGSTPRVVSADRLGRAATATAGSLSGDGRWVAFASSDPSLVRTDRNGVDDVFLRSVRASLFPRALAPH